MFNWFWDIVYLVRFRKTLKAFKEDNFKTIVNSIIDSFKIIKNKNITLIDEEKTLYENDYYKITGSAKIGVKQIKKESKEKSTTVEFKDSKCIKNNEFFKRINEVFKELKKIKEKLEKKTFEEDISNFKEKIGNSIVNGKLHFIINYEKNTIKLIFEIDDRINKDDIYGIFELLIKFKKPVIKSVEKSVTLIAPKTDSLKNNEEIIFFSLLGLIGILILGYDNIIEPILSWLYEIGTDKEIKTEDLLMNIEQNYNNYS